MTKSLLAFDTDKIKSYVFATPKLKEIRAASALLDELNRQKMVELVEQAGGKTIYANGGGGLFVVDIDSEQAESAKQAVERAYREMMASVTGAIFENYDEQKFQEQFRTLSYRLRLTKDQAQGEQNLLTHSFLHFCHSCGTEYATAVNQEELICECCRLKRERDDKFKGKANSPSEHSLNHIVKDGLWPYLISELSKKDYPIQGFDRPKDFDALGKLSSPSGYMGLIYADGDGMGKELDKIESEAQMEAFADAVDSSMYEATVEAIVEHLQPNGGDVWPFDILMLGGDDLVMVTRAEDAIEVGKTVMEKFTEFTNERYVQQYGGNPLTVSVGVVIAKVNYPFGQLRKLAESTLKFAKKERAKRQQQKDEKDETKEGGLLNFLVVNSANHLDFEEYYQEQLQDYAEEHEVHNQPKTNKRLYRTLRPYNAENLDKLLTHLKKPEIVQSPHSKLEQLRKAISQRKTQGIMDGLTTLLHWRNRKQRLAIQDVIYEFMPNPPQHFMLFPWFRHDENGEDYYYTPLLDLIELYDFVSRR